MIVGIDFDNTIVCYDGAFHLAACERGLIPADLPASKEKVRDYLRSVGREEEWTELQGYVYGARMETVVAFEGAVEGIRALVDRGARVYIISHKTQHPYRGTPYNLHDAARGWLEGSGFLRDAGLDMGQVFFELTKEQKLSRIGATNCSHFIDDLPEILLADGFPAQATRMLFSGPGNLQQDGLLSFASWGEIGRYFRGLDA